MPKTNAERQRAYRSRHLDQGSSELLNIVIAVHAKRALERMASCYGVTQRAMLERLLVAAEIDTLERVSSAEDYYERRARLAADPAIE